MTIGADNRTLAIVILPHQDKTDGTFQVCIMGLDASGQIDFDKPNRILTYTRTLGAATNYAKGLADILRIKVLQIAT